MLSLSNLQVLWSRLTQLLMRKRSLSQWCFRFLGTTIIMNRNTLSLISCHNQWMKRSLLLLCLCLRIQISKTLTGQNQLCIDMFASSKQNFWTKKEFLLISDLQRHNLSVECLRSRKWTIILSKLHILKLSSPLCLPILTEVECRYASERFRSAVNMDKTELNDYFEKAKVTIEVLAANMINTKIIATIFFLNYQ